MRCILLVFGIEGRADGSIVGGNPVSAFLSWRLQATHACDVTLVWKSGHDNVAQYGITFKFVHTFCFAMFYRMLISSKVK